MQNLFIMHTQYNLILACGIAKSRYKNDKNILALYAEFSLNDELKKNIENCFDKVYYIRESFVNASNVYQKDILTMKYLRKSRKLLSQKYDNVFLSQENMLDTYMLTKLSKKGIFNCYSIEEDVYYSVNNSLNINPPKEPKKSIRGKIHDIVLTCLIGKNKYNRFIYFYGQSDIFDGNYVLFPKQVRKEMQNNELLEVTVEEVRLGIEALYGHIENLIPKENRILLCFFDLIERYKNVDKIMEFVNQITEICTKNNITLVYKYHPRENEKFKFPTTEQFIEIPSVIPAEKVLYDCMGKDVTVLGNLSTALWVAAKMGFKVISITKIENPENEAARRALEGMNIRVLNNFKEICEDGLR